jgi:hypothetical protein
MQTISNSVTSQYYILAGRLANISITVPVELKSYNCPLIHPTMNLQVTAILFVINMLAAI